MNNKQLYTISNQQRFTLNSWHVIVPYSHLHFPVYLTNPYQLTYRKAAYIRAQSYNYSIGQQTFTYDMGVHLKPTLPNLGLYNSAHTLLWSHAWSSYPSMNNKIMYENNYNNINLPYLPMSKYQGYNNSGNKVFYDLTVHTLQRRYYNNTVKSYLTSGLDHIISNYSPLTESILSSPSCIYYLLSPQLYHNWFLTHKGQIKTPTTYLRSSLHEHIRISLWSTNFSKLWVKLSQVYSYKNTPFATLMHIFKQHDYTINKITSLLCDKYIVLIRSYPSINNSSITNYYCKTPITRGVMRIPITKSLTFLSALHVSIPKKRLWGLGSWAANYLEYYAPRTTAVMHGTGITSKLPMNKYTRVTGKAQGARALSLKLYKQLLALPVTLQGQTYVYTQARILQYITPYTYMCMNNMTSYSVVTYANKQGLTAIKVQLMYLLSLWTNVWVHLYKHSLLKSKLVYVVHKQIKSKYTHKANKQQLLPHANKLWYNRMLSKRTN